jgi:hypothetical protein
MQKNAFITVSVASFVAAILAAVALISKHPQLTNVLLVASGVLNGLLVWQFACKTKCSAELEVEDMRKDRSFEELWREVDALNNKIESKSSRR